MNIYENLNDEAKEIYAYVIEKYLGLSFYSSEIMKEKITPEVAKKVDEFLKAMHDCTKQINFFTNIFKKSNTIIGLIKAIGKEKAKEELTTAFNKTILYHCSIIFFIIFSISQISCFLISHAFL